MMLAVVSLFASMGTVARGATTITGLSDQGTTQYWPLGVQVYAESMGAKYQQARLIVPWSTGARPGSVDWNQMNDWYSYRVARRKTMLVSFNHWDGCEEILGARPWNPNATCAPLLPTTTQYRDAIEAFRRQWPLVTEFTAWNEPNHSVYGNYWYRGAWYVDGWQMNPVADPELAADYYKVLYDECGINRGGGPCTAVAGDFSDGSGSMGSYPISYKNRIAAYGVQPPAWAVHAYSAVNTGATGWLDAFFSTVNPASTTWITEVGVKVCDGGLPFVTDAAQATAGQRLVSLMGTRNPARTYYYMLFGGQSLATCPGGGPWDSGLLYENPVAREQSTLPRPAFPAIFPELGDMFWALRHANSGGPHQTGLVFSGRGIPVPGDWDGDGDDTPGMFDPATGTWYLSNRGESGHPEAVFTYGVPGDRPVVGDWDGNGRDTIGVVRGSTWYLRNYSSGGPNDIPAFDYGLPSDVPFVGDWDGNRTDTPGVYRDSWWYLRNSNTGGPSDLAPFYFGIPGDRPRPGDWNGDGIDTPAVVRGSTWYLRYSNTSGADNLHFDYGLPDDQPVVGDWASNGVHLDTPGVIR